MTDVEKKHFYRAICKLIVKLQSYCEQLPILGFNSGRYDLNLIKKQILVNCGLNGNEKGHFVIKKNNSYITIATPQYLFLDIMNFLGVGTSCDSFLKAYDTVQQKSYFPYEWLTDISKLEKTRLPKYCKFYSHLKNENTLESEYNNYVSVLDDCNGDVNVALAQLQVKTVPKTGEENYSDLQSLWKKKNFQSMRDFLIYYNNLDVIPFVEAVTKMITMYKEKNIDLFKNCVTVPSAARRLLFSSVDNDIQFAIISEKQKDIYTLFKNNIIGGPSIVMSRYHKKGETCIRCNPEKICESVYGWDTNSLYPFAMAQSMPTGPFIIRRKENNFQTDESPRWLGACEWLRYIEWRHSVKLQTAYNGGEKQIGPYFVDGWSEDTNIAYEYNGCFWHGC